MRSNKKWTNEVCTKIEKWANENNANWKETAKHFGHSPGPMMQGIYKWRKASKKAARINKTTKPKVLSLPPVEFIKVPESNSNSPDFVAVAMIPISKLSQFMESMCNK